MRFKNLIRSIFYAIYATSRKFLGGRGLRKITFVNTIFGFVARHAKNNLIEINGYKMYLDVVEGIDPSKKGVYELETTNVFKKNIRWGQVVLDVGTDIGYFTLLSAKLVGPSGKVFAFEPNPLSFSILKKNIQINNFENVFAVNKAVADKKGELPFYLHGPHSVLGYDRFSNPKTRTVVETVRLDDFLGSNQRIDFAKIDTEGSDAKVLRGMKNLLMVNRDIKLVVEFYPILLERGGDDPRQFLEGLVTSGFVIYDICGDGGVEKSVSIDDLLAKYSHVERSTNLFCERRKH